MTSDRATILCVDDEERILRSLRMLFRSRYEVLATTSGQEALQLLRGRPVHALISDQRMPEMLGVDLLRQARDVSPATMRLLLTGYSDQQAIIGSINEGEIFRFIEKPWQPQHLLDLVEQAVQVAQQDFAARTAPTLTPAQSALPGSGHRLLVLDEDAATFQLVREVTGPDHDVRHATNVETALATLAEHEIAVVIAELKHRQDDIAGSLKTLKRLNPGTLTIATSPLRDSPRLIELINQGQIYRFLPKPLSRELLRRSLHAAFSHHARIRTSPILVRRHAVEEAQFEPMSLSARLLDYWRKIRDNGRTRLSA
jgi:response regulator RpfG family c-di-GMP phosphodiesterase